MQAGGTSSYLRGISRRKLLTKEQEIELSQAIEKGRSTKTFIPTPDDVRSAKLARAKMIESNLRLVVSIAKGYQNRGCELDDLIAAGNMGLMKAVERFMIASFGMSAYKHFEPGKNGVFIVLPSGKPDCWKKFGWYTPILGDRKNYGNWSFLKDGATPGNGTVENWFELLDSWFDTPDDKGGVNGYRP